MRMVPETFLVRSSARPAPKASRPQTPMIASSSRIAAGAASVPAQKPANTATPPIRGTTCRCTFCGPLRLSRLIPPCQRLVATINTLATNDTPAPSTAGSAT